MSRITTRNQLYFHTLNACMVILMSLLPVSSSYGTEPSAAILPELIKESGEALEADRIHVVIGVTNSNQHPITFEDGSGLSADISQALNKIQNKYYFEHTILPTKRLQDFVKKGIIHIAAFHNLSWGWDAKSVNRSNTLIKARDVYFSLKENQDASSFFSNLPNVSKIGVQGFFYKFLNGESNQNIIKKYHHMWLVRDEQTVIKMVLLKRAPVGIVSTLTLQYFEMKNPELYNKLLISDKYDTEYDRYYVLPKNAPIPIEDLNAYLLKLNETGVLQQLFNQYGLQPQNAKK